jgi:hypothetical protein
VQRKELWVIGAVERYVQATKEETAPTDRDGFLGLGRASGATPVSRLVWQSRSFVLLAPGGAGKTVVLNDLRQQEDGVEVDLVGLTGPEIRQEIDAALATGKPIFIDALDEALLTQPMLVRLVNRALRSAGTGGAPWRLACRPSAWTDAFVDVDREVDRLQLLPMTREASGCLLRSVNVDEGFLEVLSESGQSRLGASLLHFIATARQWQKEGVLPGRRADVLVSEIQRLLAERDDVRPSLRTGADLRLQVAGRLAFLTAFGAAARFAFRTTAIQPAVTSEKQSTVAIDDLPTVPEPDRPDATIGREIYEEVLGSALFDVAPHSTVAFRHQEYADYLAAKYVVDRKPLRSQVTDLFALTDGVLPRSMASVAAWTVVLKPGLVDVFAAANAKVLVESGLDLPLDTRAKVVDALLADAREHHAPPPWSLDLSVVAHPELGRQLDRRLASGDIRPLEAWWIFRLALTGRIEAAVPGALTIALDSRLASWVRRPAIEVVTALGTQSQRSALLDGLTLDENADPDDELRAGLLEGLYPRDLTTTQLLTFVSRPRKSTFFGAYRKFLRDFPTRVPDPDLPEALSWARDCLQSQISHEARLWASDLAGRLVERAVAASDDPSVLQPLAELVIHQTGRVRIRALWAQDTALRQRLALAVAARLEERQWYVLLRLDLLTSDDADWLTSVIGEQPSTARTTLTRCLHRLTAPPAPPDDTPETVLEASEDQLDPDALRAAIAASRDDLDAWPDIPIALVPGSAPRSLFFCDLASRPGWSLLTPDERQEILDRGLAYLAEHQPHPDRWLGKARMGSDALRDWSGVCLLTTLIGHAPERIRDIPLRTWTQWAPAIANARVYHDQYLLADLVTRAPAQAKAEILAAVRADLNIRTEWRPTALHVLFARDLTPDLAAKVQQRPYPDPENASALGFLIEHDPDRGADTARLLATGDGSQLSRAANRHLASIDSAGTIDRLLTEAITADAFLELLQGINLHTVDDEHVAALARVLLERFPLGDDASQEDAAWAQDIPERPPFLWCMDALQALAERGLSGELAALATGRPAPERELIGYYLHQARQRAADIARTHLRPADLLDLLGRADLRLVRNSADLLRLLTDHLGELQHELSRGNAFRDLWSPDGKELGSEDDITDWVRRRLEQRFGRDRGVLVRESQIERLSVRGSGTRIDLAVSTPTSTAPVGVANVTIEAKLVTNSELTTGLRDQLVERYLAATGQRHGIYLVYWTPPDQRKPSAHRNYDGKQQLLDEMRSWAAEIAPPYTVDVYVLDVSWPNGRS